MTAGLILCLFEIAGSAAALNIGNCDHSAEYVMVD